jgi:hypothetical protein
MPKVGKMKFAYGPKGMAAAKKTAKKTGLPMMKMGMMKKGKKKK